VVSKKGFRRYGTSRGRMALIIKYPIFLFFLISVFLVPLADTISAEPSPENFQLGDFMFVQVG